MPTTYSAHLAESLFENGIGNGQVIVLRKKSPAKVEAGVFMMDSYCLGVRDAFLYEGTEAEVKERILTTSPYPLREMPAGYGRKFIEEAIAYAKQFGFAPHKDYKKAARAFGGLKAANDLDGFTFGKNGKPFYIQSRHHDENDAHRIIAKLTRVCGEDGFDFLCKIESEDDDNEFEERVVLSEGWLDGESPLDDDTDEPTEAAVRAFKAFRSQDDFNDDPLFDNYRWETPDGYTTIDRVLKVCDTVMKVCPDDEEGNAKLRQNLPHIIMFFMNLCDLSEDEIDQQIKDFETKSKTFSSALFDVFKEMWAQDNFKEMIYNLVHPTAEISQRPISIEWLNKESGHLLFICFEQYDPESPW